MHKVTISQHVLSGYLAKGYRIADLAGMTQEQLDAMYALAYQLYQADNFKDAAAIFQGLVLFDSSNSDYLMGLASSEQGLEHYERASDLFAMVCAHSGMTDPKPMYYSCICALKNGERDKAILGLKTTIEVIGARGGNAEDELYLTKCRELLKLLQSVAPSDPNSGSMQA